jgi:hypothetical protein
MRSSTRDRLLFAGLAVAYTLAMAIAYYLIERRIDLPDFAGAVIPVVAVMAAARGFPLRRKVIFICGTLGGIVALEAIVRLSGLDPSAAAAANIRTTPVTVLIPSLLYTTVIPFVYPVMALVLFVGSHPTRLWESRHYHGSGHKHHRHSHRGRTKRRAE